MTEPHAPINFIPLRAESPPRNENAQPRVLPVPAFSDVSRSPMAPTTVFSNVQPLTVGVADISNGATQRPLTTAPPSPAVRPLTGGRP